MKLHGRITFFGEHLLKNNQSYCLCIKSKLFLSNEQQYDKIGNSNYSKDKDGTIPSLISMGISNFSNIYGNLPLGYGLSSSTILSILHLKSNSRKDLIRIVDKEMNGFSPSELDYISIVKQENGVYGFGEWYSLIHFQPIYSLIIVPKERQRTLAEVKSKLYESQEPQIKLTKNLSQLLISTGDLDFDLLYEYCQLLMSYKIYSSNAMEIIEDLISQGISCKCIGGLYDKAILVVHSDAESKILCDRYISDNYKYSNILE